MHPDIREMSERIVTDERRSFDGELSGKINMGIGGVNGVVISKVWRFDPTVRQMARILGIAVDELRARLEAHDLDTEIDENGIERVSYETYRKLAAAQA